QNGRISFLPHNIYANMPLGSELLSVWAMSIVGGKDGWWWGALAGKTIMACYPLIAAAGLIAFGHRLHSFAAGVIAAVVFLSAPWIIFLGEAGLNEGPVAMYAILAIFAMWLAADKNSKGESMSWEPNTRGSVFRTDYFLLSPWGIQPTVARFIALAGF